MGQNRLAPGQTTAARRPQQARGQRRVEAILDAAAGVVAELGVAGLTMQDVGRRSRTTSGSLYHFFPDRDALLRGLAARHVERLRAVVAPVAALGPAEWARLSVEERVERFVGPMLDYIERNTDVLAVMGAAAPAAPPTPGTEELLALVRRAAERVVAACDPTATRGDRTARAALLIAAIEGALMLSGRPAAPPHRTVLRELRRMLVAYLADGTSHG